MTRILFDGEVSPVAPGYEGEPQATLDLAPLDPDEVEFSFKSLPLAMGEDVMRCSPGVIASIAPDPEGSGAWGLVVVYAGGPPELQPERVRVRVTEPDPG